MTTRESTRLGDHFVTRLGAQRAQKRTSEAVQHVSDYSGSITTTAIPGSSEQNSAPSILRRAASRLVRSTAYTVASFPLFILWVSVFSAVYGTIFSLLFVGVGFLMLPFALQATGIAGNVERWLMQEILGESIEQPRRLQRGRGPASFFLTPMQDSSYWRELAFICGRLLLAPLSFAVLLLSIAGGIVGLTALLWGSIADLLIEETVATFFLGVLSITIGPMLLLLFTSAQVSMANALLGPDNRTLTARANIAVRHQELSLTSAEAERQRIERDLHDGAQARLATVALDLGRAKRRLEREGGDSELADIIDSAHGDAKEAIIELRNLARGIHPAVLTDRGLDAALSDVAARCTVPVHLDVHLLVRPAAHIESASYFAVSELLTNITKHSRASQAWVTVRGSADTLRIDVSDNGLGGADHGLGSGLLGLRDRINSVDGQFNVQSPLAGGTSCFIEIPLQQQNTRAS